ncbi:hypothetical protein HY612_05485, partial [Candidatus Roizmanbacteria bacterium]|nr:hypothetical protein [Candidatus Roizmanbacteria bacterium]
FILQKINQEPKERHIHAGFQVYVDGRVQDFSESKYMSLIVCEKEVDQAKKTRRQIQIEKAHLHDNVGDVVHSEREGAVWRDLFKNLNFKIDQAKSSDGYVNGKKVANIFAYPINAYDSTVIFIGRSDKKLLKNSVTRKRIREVEKEGIEC